jgi:homoserine O-acetyltransferase
MEENIFKLNYSFPLENGETLQQAQIKYHTAGSLNAAKDNCIWVCHALTANSEVADWWPGIYGEDGFLNPNEFFIVCANILSSPYGSTNPLSESPSTGQAYFLSFPQITIRDMVNAHIELRKHLEIEKIHTLIGGSIGGFQAIEWAIMEPDRINHLAVIASSVQASPWHIAFNESQRLAIEADTSFFEQKIGGGNAGLKAARSMALLSYRNSLAYNITQKEENNEKLEGYKAGSYQQYQGDKLVNRFNAYSYYYISKAFDSHNAARQRGSLSLALAKIKAKTLFVGISSDILFPPNCVKNGIDAINDSNYIEIDSIYGHDGFLLEHKQLNPILKVFAPIENLQKAKQQFTL